MHTKEDPPEVGERVTIIGDPYLGTVTYVNIEKEFAWVVWDIGGQGAPNFIRLKKVS